VGRTQLGETLARSPSNTRVLDGPIQQGNDLVVSSEVGKVLERQINRPANSAGGTQVSKFVGVSLTAGHATTIDPRPDASLHSH
jgi:hypothetical protein